MYKLKICILSLTIVALSLACGGGGGDTGGGIGGTGLQKASELPYYSSNVLAGYTSQNELEDDLIAAANLMAYEIIDGQIKTYTFIEEDIAADQLIQPINFAAEFAGDVATDDETAEASGDSVDLSADSFSQSESDFETNVEIDSIDEGDSSKSNGNLLFFAKGSELLVCDLSGNTTARILFDSSLHSDLSGTETEELQSLLIHNDDLYSLSWKTTIYSSDSLTYGTTRLSRFNITSEGNLNLLESKNYAGYYKAFRKSEEQLFLVQNITINNYGHFRELYRGFYSAASDENFSSLASSNIQALAESWKDKVIDEIFTAHNRSLDSDDLTRIVRLHQNLSGSESEADEDLNASLGLGSVNAYIQIAIFDLSVGLASEELSGKFTSKSYQNLVYIDGENILIGSTGLTRSTSTEYRDSTFVTNFEVQAGAAQATAIGSVQGYVPDTFGTRVRNDVFEFISTQPARFEYSNGSWSQVQDRVSMVSTFEIDNTEFSQLGFLSGLGNNQTLTSSRFIGDRAYVVTFEFVDPFYVIDLSDASQPTILGELEIPGFSSYLHPVSDNIIIGVGRDDSELLLNLFDVSDDSNPTSIQQLTVPGYSSSGVESDHKAFRYLSSSNTLVLPVSSFVYDGTSYTHEDGFRIYSVDETTGFTSMGNIDLHQEVSGALDYNCFSNSYLSPRSFFFSPDQLVTVKGHVVASSNLSDLNLNWQKDLSENSLDTNATTCYDWFGILAD